MKALDLARLARWVWPLLFMTHTALAQQPPGASVPRTELAATAAVDAAGAVWVVFARGGQVWVQRGLDNPAPPVAVNAQPLKISAQHENRPKIALTPSGVVIVSFTVAGTARFSGHVFVARSTDGGRSFSTPQRLNDDARDISHRFDSLIIENSGRVRVVWIDRRDAEDAKTQGQTFTGASVYTAWSGDDGASWSPNQRLSASSCECCRIALANDPAGPTVALWRHVFAGNLRDHALMPVSSGARVRATFSNWQLEACPHHGPALAIDPEGTRHLAWFSGGARAGLYHSRLDAQGTPVGRPHLLAATGAHPALATQGRNILAAWLMFDGTRYQLQYARSADGGLRWAAPTTLASTRGAADYPQWLIHGDRVEVFWRTADEGFQRIRLPGH